MLIERVDKRLFILPKRFIQVRFCSTEIEESFIINKRKYARDATSNLSPKILSLLGRELHRQKQHPLCLIKDNITDYMYKSFRSNRGNPLFSLHDQINPVVTIEQNFDSLLVPKDHVSRNVSDSYYLNRDFMLRAHTSAHQTDLIKMGLDNFLVVGDVYRRDTVDKTHYPVFHQMEGVRLIDQQQLGRLTSTPIQLFEAGERSEYKQGVHTLDAAKITEVDLKNCLTGLAQHLFGKSIEYRWVDTYFPFTHPSWELEVFYNDEWLEVLGCGVMEQEILSKAGVNDKVGWAFGLGLERLAMILYKIPDIRLFWSSDPGFLNQFSTAKPDSQITFTPFSKCPPCINDISFWLPNEAYSSNDFYDLVREVGGDIVEQVSLVDDFFHKKKGLNSHCYRITYRDMSRVLSQEEVNVIHKEIETKAAEKLNVVIR